MADLLALDSEEDEKIGFNINKGYADNYERWRGKEELQKFADRYGEAELRKLDESGESSTSSSEEDEDAKEWTPQVDKQFFKALSCLKKKDPKIYDSKIRFFEKSEAGSSQNTDNVEKKKKEKSMFLRDYERKMILERGGQASSDEESDSADKRPLSPTFVKEQAEIKESFKAALKDSSDEEEQESGIGGLFQPRKKTKDEKTKEEEDYREWLKGQKKDLKSKDDAKDLDYLKSYWNDPKLDKGEAFLRDYLLNKRYLEEEDENYIPTYDEIVHDSDEGGLSGDEREVEQMDQFEHKYNFRFEEPDQEFVKRYPRTMQSSIRQKDERRKQHRDEVKERKAHEKEVKRQQLKQLKAIKRKEIAERLEKLKKITGNTEVEFEDDDLNEDFDPDKHDKRMQTLFDNEFYAGEEDDEKPEFPDLDEELEIENWDEFENSKAQFGASASGESYEPHCEDPDFNMDCDYDPKTAHEQEMLASQSRPKKGRRKSKLSEALAKKKPKFDRDQQQAEQYMDEYYGLDYEDMIADLPCRFKYRNVVPNSFGLTVEEILMADDKELNRWCSLKKTSQYRTEDQERFDVQAFTKKANMEALKRKILPSLFTQENEEDGDDQQASPTKKKKKNKKKKKINAEQSTNGDSGLDNSAEVESPSSPIMSNPADTKEVTSPSAVKKKKKKRKNDNTNPIPDVPDNYNPAEQTLQVKEKKKKRKSVNTNPIPDVPDKPAEQTLQVKEKKKKKKRKAEEEVPEPSQQPKKKKLALSEEAKPQKQKKKFKSNKVSNIGKSNQTQASKTDLSDSRLKAYGINPKKFKNKMKYGKKK